MRPDVSALAATNTADEARVDVTQPDIIGPLVGDYLDGVRAPIITAIARLDRLGLVNCSQSFGNCRQ
jgi:hypothetical protein